MHDALRLRGAEPGGDPAARRNDLPVDRITKTRVLDPHFY